ncbi:MAG TPA: SPFH domain-containing protein [Armatimonadota bacterium]|jgi:regulator of protease activity HflC (stomatin/prohibitin superfamily)
MDAIVVAVISFFGFLIGMPILGAIIRFLGLYTIVQERQAQVFMLFGKVLGVVDEPGLHFLPARIGPKALLMCLGKKYIVDMRLDQTYLRSQAVNSEEGAPMGIGIWYEMFIMEPVDYIFKNADPKGSLAANVSNATVRSLSNMPLATMLEDRHTMSLTVRKEVSALSQEWGYKLGSVYIRKVHFRDAGMIRQIEEKVVNRLRQVTSAIRQDGANQVSIIQSTAEKEAAIEFGKAAAIHPLIIGKALEKITEDKEISDTMFEILENQKLLEGKVDITLVPVGSQLLPELLAAGGQGRKRAVSAEQSSAQAAPKPTGS